jgi:helicase
LETRELSKFGISQSLISKLEQLGYHKLTTIQQRAIEGGLFGRKNLLVIAPTNTGKTFVGELAALVTSTFKESTYTFFLVPLKALAEEKFQDFTNKYAKWGLKVAISTSDKTEFDEDLLSYQVIIATYEKMNALLVRNPDLIDRVGLVIVDELQNIGDPSRGVTLEILLTTLVISLKRPQLIGLSATISNAKQVAQWLDAALIETDKRDVELREGILYTGADTIKFSGHTLEKGDFIYREFNSGIIDCEKGLQYETLEAIRKASADEQILVFVQTQRDAETYAHRLAGVLPSATNVAETLEMLDSAVESTPSTRRLKESLQNGVAFHHAGLFPDERLIVEDSFNKGHARIIFATTTLSAGVNTPAKTVIVLSHQTYEKKNIRTLDYKNMAGRAGRIRAADNFGRSVLFAENEREMEMLWKEYVTAKTEPLESQIGKSERLDRSILGLLCSGVCNDTSELLTFMKATFFGQVYYRQTSEQLRNTFDESLVLRVKALERDGFLTIEDDKITVTELGIRCAQEMLSPSTVKLFYDVLKKHESTLSKTHDYSKLIEPIIHLTCCSVDAVANGALNFYPRNAPELKELSDYWEYNKNSFLHRPADKVLLVRSLKTTRMLMRWIDGVPYGDLSSYAPHGIIKRNAETISWIMKGLSRIAEKPLLDFDYEFVRFLRTLSERLFFGVPESALFVMRMRIPQIHRNRAMALANTGFSSIDEIIEAKPEDLTKVHGIREKLALQIKKAVEEYIDDKNLAAYHRQRRIAQSLTKTPLIVDRLYKEKGDDFARTLNEIFRDHIGLDSAYVGDAPGHDVDVIIETENGKIVIESRRLERKGNVSANEAEEVIGKGAKYKPIANVTVGYPDFSDEAKRNASKSKVTLIPASVVGELLIGFWQEKLDREAVLQTLMSGRYVEDAYQESRQLELIR